MYFEMSTIDAAVGGAGFALTLAVCWFLWRGVTFALRDGEVRWWIPTVLSFGVALLGFHQTLVGQRTSPVLHIYSNDTPQVIDAKKLVFEKELEDYRRPADNFIPTWISCPMIVMGFLSGVGCWYRADCVNLEKEECAG